MKLFLKYSNLCNHNYLNVTDGQIDDLSWQYHTLHSIAGKNYALSTNTIIHFLVSNGKGKGKGKGLSTCYSAAYRG